jgi:glycosyltransferase involved in cell wall biosynthesis
LWRQVRQRIEQQAHEWDVVLIGGPNPVGQYVAQLCIDLGRPVVLVVRQNLVPQLRFAHRGLKRILSVGMALWLEWRFRQLARGRTVFAVGQEMTDAYRRVSARTHHHFASLIDDAQLAALAAIRPQPEPGRLLYVGRLSAEKGFAYLLPALAQLKQAGIPFTLELVGSGPLEEELRAQVAQLGLDSQVTFHGYVAYGPDLLKLYQRALALVVPSLSGEGFPQVINEALAVGTPVVASRVGGIPAFLTHGETAWLIPPADIPALVSALNQVLHDAALRRRLSEQGRLLMRDNTLEATRDRLVKILETEVLHEPIRPHALRPG